MKLPIKINTIYYNECWSIEKFCIIDTNNEYKEWKFSNYNWITNNNENEIVYGKNGHPYDQHKVFNEILEIHNFLYSEIKEKHLIQFLQTNLKQKRYILLNIYYEDIEYLHEILIYGFDKKKLIFYYFEPYNKNSQLSVITYNDLIKLYRNTISNFKNWFEKFAYRFKYCFPLSTMKLKKNLNYNKINILELHLFLKNILEYKNYTSNGYIFDEKKRTYYDGLLGIINILFDEFKKYIKDKKEGYNFPLNFKRYIVYRLFFYDLLKNFFKKYNITNLTNENYLIEQKQLNNILLVLLKNKIYSEKIIYEICDKLIAINENDYQYILKLNNYLLKEML